MGSIDYLFIYSSWIFHTFWSQIMKTTFSLPKVRVQGLLAPLRIPPPPEYADLLHSTVWRTVWPRWGLGGTSLPGLPPSRWPRTMAAVSPPSASACGSWRAGPRYRQRRFLIWEGSREALWLTVRKETCHCRNHERRHQGQAEQTSSESRYCITWGKSTNLFASLFSSPASGIIRGRSARLWDLSCWLSTGTQHIASVAWAPAQAHPRDVPC